MKSGGRLVSPPSKTAPNIIASPRAKKLYRDPDVESPPSSAAATEAARGGGSYSSGDDLRYQQQQQQQSSGNGRANPQQGRAVLTLPAQSSSGSNQPLNSIMQQQQPPQQQQQQQPQQQQQQPPQQQQQQQQSSSMGYDINDDYYNMSNPMSKLSNQYNSSSGSREINSGSPINLLTSSNSNLSYEEVLQKLSYVEGRLKSSLQDSKNETEERKRISLKNIELTKQLAQSKRGLQEMQLLLKSIKESTDDMSRKRDQRDRELVRVMQENKDLLFKSNKSDATNRELLETCRELQGKYEDSQKSAESLSQKEHRKYQKEIRALKEQIRDREEDVRRAQMDFTESQENYSRLRSDVLRLHGERTIMQAELETVKSQCVTLEGSYTKIQAELYELRREKTTIFNEYKQEIDRMRRIVSKDQLGDGSFLSSFAEDAMAADNARRSLDGRFGSPYASSNPYTGGGSPQQMVVMSAAPQIAPPSAAFITQHQPFTAPISTESSKLSQRSTVASMESGNTEGNNTLWSKVKTLVPEKKPEPSFIAFTKGLVEEQKAKKKKLENDLKEWNRMFITINGRAATKEEQSTQAKDIVDQIKEVSSEVKRTRATIVSGKSNNAEVTAAAPAPSSSPAATAPSSPPAGGGNSKWAMLKN